MSKKTKKTESSVVEKRVARKSIDAEVWSKLAKVEQKAESPMLSFMPYVGVAKQRLIADSLILAKVPNLSELLGMALPGEAGFLLGKLEILGYNKKDDFEVLLQDIWGPEAGATSRIQYIYVQGTITRNLNTLGGISMLTSELVDKKVLQRCGAIDLAVSPSKKDKYEEVVSQTYSFVLPLPENLEVREVLYRAFYPGAYIMHNVEDRSDQIRMLAEHRFGHRLPKEDREVGGKLIRAWEPTKADFRFASEMGIVLDPSLAI